MSDSKLKHLQLAFTLQKALWKVEKTVNLEYGGKDHSDKNPISFMAKKWYKIFRTNSMRKARDYLMTKDPLCV